MSNDAPTPRGRILWDVIQEHLDEAEFLFERWSDRLDAPHYCFEELASRLEQRLEAHLDGLLTGGAPVAERLLRPLLVDAKEPRLATVAALVLLRSKVREDRQAPFGALQETEGEQRAGLARGLELSEQAQVDLELPRQLEREEDPELRATILEVMTARGQDAGSALRQCLEADSRQLRLAAIRAAGLGGRRDQVVLIEHFLDLKDPTSRIAAVEAGLTLGVRDAWRVCLGIARRQEPGTARAMLLVALLGGRRDHFGLLEAQLGQERTREAALWAIGFTGNARCGDLCLPFLRGPDERSAKLAAEALAAIGGFDQLSGALRGTWKPDEAAEARQALPPLEEDDLEADLVPDGVDDLPSPDAAAIEQRWSEVRPGLREEVRALAGVPHSAGALLAALRGGPARRRHAHALELVIRTGGQRRLSTRALAARQRSELAALASLQDRELSGERFGGW